MSVLFVCVFLFLTSEFSGTGRYGATLFSLSWRASPSELPSELHQLLFELIQSVVGEEKPL